MLQSAQSICLTWARQLCPGLTFYSGIYIVKITIQDTILSQDLKCRFIQAPLCECHRKAAIDTGQLFPYKLDLVPSFFRHTLRSRIQNLGLFSGPQKFQRASEAGKKKIYNSTIFWVKNKVRSYFILEKLMDFLLFNKVFQNFFFSKYLSKKLPL